MQRIADVWSCMPKLASAEVVDYCEFVVPTANKVENLVHAEVCARRALRIFLLDELRKILSGGPSVLQPIPRRCSSSSSTVDNGDAFAGFELRPGVELHMYTSEPPCGDAAIFGLEDIPPPDWSAPSNVRLAGEPQRQPRPPPNAQAEEGAGASAGAKRVRVRVEDPCGGTEAANSSPSPELYCTKSITCTACNSSPLNC